MGHVTVERSRALRGGCCHGTWVHVSVVCTTSITISTSGKAWRAVRRSSKSIARRSRASAAGAHASNALRRLTVCAGPTRSGKARHDAKAVGPRGAAGAPGAGRGQGAAARRSTVTPLATAARRATTRWCAAAARCWRGRRRAWARRCWRSATRAAAPRSASPGTAAGRRWWRRCWSRRAHDAAQQCRASVDHTISDKGRVPSTLCMLVPLSSGMPSPQKKARA